MTGQVPTRVHLDTEGWRGCGDATRFAPLALWVDNARVYALLRDFVGETTQLASVDSGAYTPLSATMPAAHGHERMMHDLWGHGDARPAWFDHGNWTVTQPLSPRPGAPDAEPAPAAFLGENGDHATRWMIGPVTADMTAARHWRLRLNGTRVVGVQRVAGFAHRGALALMRGQSPRAAARFTCRLSARACVGHAIAFARATEAASRIIAPPRARHTRALMLEIERICAHLRHLEEIAGTVEAHATRDAAALAREAMSRAAESAFGHRLMMDVVTPGGLARDIDPEGVTALRDGLAELRALASYWGRLVTARRYGTRLRGLGTLPRALAASLALGGPAGRAAGLAWDLRSADSDLTDQPWHIAMAAHGDALDRLAVRVLEIEIAVRLIERLSASLPGGAVSVPLESADGEGLGHAEAADGEVWHWVRLDGGRIAASFARDPEWALSAALDAALIGVDTDDVNLLLRDLGAAAAGGDL